MTHVFKHPKYYKELRERNKSDQAICDEASTEATSVRPGPGLKQQAIEETVPHNDIEEASGSSNKQQADKAQATKTQASSSKRQAPSDSKTLEQES